MKRKEWMPPDAVVIILGIYEVACLVSGGNGDGNEVDLDEE